MRMVLQLMWLRRFIALTVWLVAVTIVRNVYTPQYIKIDFDFMLFLSLFMFELLAVKVDFSCQG